MARRTVWTVGHSTRPLDELVAILESAGVTRLVDVRSIPRSRTNPQFNIDALPAALAPHGIEYCHLAALGGRRPLRRDVPSRNPGWEHPAFRAYADYAGTPAFRSGLGQLELLALERPTAIMCAEAVWWRCHRRLIADYLIVRGWSVVHLMGVGRSEPARLTPGTRVLDDGVIEYLGNPDAR
ncbi:MAG TPA: DUF488 domain-containing protein [Vicinamibacterales bacterium]